MTSAEMWQAVGEQAYADHLDAVKAGRIESFTARVLEMPARGGQATSI